MAALEAPLLVALVWAFIRDRGAVGDAPVAKPPLAVGSLDRRRFADLLPRQRRWVLPSQRILRTHGGSDHENVVHDGDRALVHGTRGNHAARTAGARRRLPRSLTNSRRKPRKSAGDLPVRTELIQGLSPPSSSCPYR